MWVFLILFTIAAASALILKAITYHRASSESDKDQLSHIEIAYMVLSISRVAFNIYIIVLLYSSVKLYLNSAGPSMPRSQICKIKCGTYYYITISLLGSLFAHLIEPFYYVGVLHASDPANSPIFVYMYYISCALNEGQMSLLFLMVYTLYKVSTRVKASRIRRLQAAQNQTGPTTPV
jgi:predicted small integral membrane protein